MDDEDIDPLDPFTWRERIIFFSVPGIHVLAGWAWVYRRWDDFLTYRWLNWFPPKKTDDVPRETSTPEGDPS